MHKTGKPQSLEGKQSPSTVTVIQGGRHTTREGRKKEIEGKKETKGNGGHKIKKIKKKKHSQGFGSKNIYSYIKHRNTKYASPRPPKRKRTLKTVSSNPLNTSYSNITTPPTRSSPLTASLSSLLGLTTKQHIDLLFDPVLVIRLVRLCVSTIPEVAQDIITYFFLSYKGSTTSIKIICRLRKGSICPHNKKGVLGRFYSQNEVRRKEDDVHILKPSENNV